MGFTRTFIVTKNLIAEVECDFYQILIVLNITLPSTSQFGCKAGLEYEVSSLKDVD